MEEADNLIFMFEESLAITNRKSNEVRNRYSLRRRTKFRNIEDIFDYVIFGWPLIKNKKFRAIFLDFFLQI